MFIDSRLGWGIMLCGGDKGEEVLSAGIVKKFEMKQYLSEFGSY